MNLTECFAGLEDGRHPREKVYKFVSLMFVALCALMAGEDSFVGMAEYGEINRDTLAQYIELPDRMPTHDTYNRLFGVLDTASFNSWFEKFSKTIFEYLESKNIGGEEHEKHLALDGKTICNSGFDRPFHILHAWCVQNKLLLMQKKVDQKTNEITAMPVVLEMLDIKNAVITIDAMGAQREICKLIIDKEGDYVIGLKENQPSLYEDVRDHFKMLPGMDHVSFSHCDKGHGRFEKRTCYAIDDLDWLKEEHKWPGLKSIIAVHSIVEQKEKKSEYIRYYISSLPADAERLLKLIRAHWGIENQLHWVLDCSWNEDNACIRLENATLNMSTGRKIALNILSAVQDPKKSLKSMQRQCWNPNNVFKMLGKFLHA
jgi:predicted transposase YbfD/YdcC